MEIKIKADGVLYGAIASFILAILKWCGKIDWAWVWILSPLWIMCSILIIILFIGRIWIRRTMK